MRWRGVRPLMLAILVAGCSIGTNPEHFIPAVSPNGVRGTLLLKDGTSLPVELLAVSDSALTVLVRDSVAIAGYDDVARLQLVQIGTAYRFTPGTFLDEARMASRYPAGIPDHVMTALLGVSGQTAPLVLRARR